MRRWLKRIGLAVAVLLAVGLVVAAVVAWRATRVPAWYAAAVDQTPPDADADRVLNDKILPLQNWLARTSAGDLDAKPDAEKVYALDLTEPEINAVIAKLLDNVHGRCETFRVRLTPGRIDVAFNWTEQGRTVTVTADVGRATVDGVDRPTLALGGVRLGNQGVPLAWVAGPAVGQAKKELDAFHGQPARVDDHNGASPHTVAQYYAQLKLGLLDAQAVSPEAFLPRQLADKDWVATRLTRLDVTDGRLGITFRMLTPPERQAVNAALARPPMGD